MPIAQNPLPRPQDRARFSRRTSRVLVVDEDHHILLFLDSDLGVDPVPHWWMTPGGGVDPGEDDHVAAARELDEETGLVLPPSEIFGPIALRRVTHGYSDVIVEQEEVFFGVRVARFDPSPRGYTEEEAACIVEQRWVPRRGLDALAEPLWPASLAAIWDHWDDMVAQPTLPHLDLPDTEESVIPV